MKAGFGCKMSFVIIVKYVVSCKHILPLLCMSLQFFQVFKHKFKSYIHKQTVLYIYCILLNNILYVFKFHDIFT